MSFLLLGNNGIQQYRYIIKCKMCLPQALKTVKYMVYELYLIKNESKILTQ